MTPLTSQLQYLEKQKDNHLCGKLVISINGFSFTNQDTCHISRTSACNLLYLVLTKVTIENRCTFSILSTAYLMSSNHYRPEYQFWICVKGYMKYV